MPQVTLHIIRSAMDWAAANSPLHHPLNDPETADTFTRRVTDTLNTLDHHGRRDALLRAVAAAMVTAARVIEHDTGPDATTRVLNHAAGALLVPTPPRDPPVPSPAR